MATRSEALRLEVAAMARIERAMTAIDDLPEPMQARVRRWVAETYAAPVALPAPAEALLDGAGK